MERQQRMNTFGAQAMAYWQKWLPSRFQAIEDPQAFFADLGEQVQDLITTGTLEWEHRDRDQLNSLDYLERVGRLNAIKASVTEQVMADLVWLEPEPDTVEADYQPGGSDVDPMTEWVDEEGMPLDRDHPLHRMLEDDTVTPAQYKTELQAFYASLPGSTSSSSSSR